MATITVPEGSISYSLIENGWFHEKNAAWPGICNSYHIDKILAFHQSEYQEILIFSAKNSAIVLVLDGIIQFDTLWEHIYHEMMVHIPLFAHPKPCNVLVLGGGDGGCIREILKHECIQNVIWCEIDEAVINLTKQFCPSVHCKEIYDDQRVHQMIGDGIKYVKQCKNECFDVIIVDGTDPIGTSPSASLFTSDFYKNCHRILTNGGIVCSQNECLFDENISNVLLSSFKDSKLLHKRGNVKYCSMYTPMFTSGQLLTLLSRKYSSQMMQKYGSIAVDRIYRKIPDKIQKSLKYYSEKMHSASFVLPYQNEMTLSKL